MPNPTNNATNATKYQSEHSTESLGGTWRDMADALPQIVWMSGPQGDIQFVNRAFSQYTGLDGDGRKIGLDWQMIVHPDDLDGCMESRARSIAAGLPWEFEYRLLRAHDGAYLWHRARCTPLRDGDGGVTGWVGTAADIHDLHDAEERQRLALAAAEEKAGILDALMQYVPEGITIADAPDVTIRMVSRYGQGLTERDEERLTGIPAEKHPERWGIFHADGVTPAAPEELPLTRATVSGEVVENEEWVLVRPSGERLVISCNAGPIRGEDGTVTGGLIAWRDITEQRLLMDQHARVAESLVRSLLIQPDLMRFDGVEVYPHYEAAVEADRIGGDIYDAFALDGGKVALVVGDATGKGLTASADAADIKFTLRAFLRLDPEADPASALRLMNRHVLDRQRLDGHGDMMLLCLAVAVLDPATGDLRLGVAGMEPPLILRGASGGAGGEAQAVMEAAGPILGVESYWNGHAVRTHMERGDLLLLYTDGLTEARKGKRGDFFNPEGVARAAVAAAASMTTPSLPAVAEAVTGAVRAHAGGALADDCCLLLARRRDLAGASGDGG